MDETLSLKVLTPLGPVIETTVTEVTAPGIQGEFGILPSHTPYLASLTDGLVSYDEAGQRKSLLIKGGVAEVSRDAVVILTEETHLPEDLDPEELKDREEEIHARLEHAMEVGEPAGDILDEMAFLELLKSLSVQGDASM
jgi:F-type H+-transporting ATPase subunit epsilon